MGIILNKSKVLKPKGVKEIRVKTNLEPRAINIVKGIAKSFGEQSKKNKPKKFLIR